MQFPPIKQVLIIWFSIFWLVSLALWGFGQFSWYTNLPFLVRVFILVTCVVFVASYAVIPGFKFLLQKLKI